MGRRKRAELDLPPVPVMTSLKGPRMTRQFAVLACKAERPDTQAVQAGAPTGVVVEAGIDESVAAVAPAPARS